MTISSLDHVAIPIDDVDGMLSFYESLGFHIEKSLAPRLYSVVMGDQKINFHAPTLWTDSNFELRGPSARPGCGDMCFVWDSSEDSLREHLSALSIKVLEGPAIRQGGRSSGSEFGTSYYIRDPDQNLLEFICYKTQA